MGFDELKMQRSREGDSGIEVVVGFLGVVEEGGFFVL